MYDYSEACLDVLLSQTSKSTEAFDLRRSVVITPGSVAPKILSEEGEPVVGRLSLRSI